MGDVIDFKRGLSAEIVPLFVGGAAETNVTPPTPARSEFGLRKPGLVDLAGGFREAWTLATAPRPEDGEAQRRIKDAARAARRALDGARSPVHPTLLLAFAAKMETFATLAVQLEAEARSIGLTSDAETFNNIASIIETRAAIVEGAAQ